MSKEEETFIKWLELCLMRARVFQGCLQQLLRVFDGAAGVKQAKQEFKYLEGGCSRGMHEIWFGEVQAAFLALPQIVQSGQGGEDV